MDTEVWGPAAWLFIHSAALAYPESNPSAEVRENYKRFFESLVSVLPCAYCRNHYKDNIDTLPIIDALDSRASLFRWTVDLHNQVNRSLRKPELDYVQALVQIQKKFSENTPQRRKLSRSQISAYITVLLFLIGGSVYVICRRKRTGLP